MSWEPAIGWPGTYRSGRLLAAVTARMMEDFTEPTSVTTASGWRSSIRVTTPAIVVGGEATTTTSTGSSSLATRPAPRPAATLACEGLRSSSRTSIPALLRAIPSEEPTNPVPMILTLISSTPAY